MGQPVEVRVFSTAPKKPGFGRVFCFLSYPSEHCVLRGIASPTHPFAARFQSRIGVWHGEKERALLAGDWPKTNGIPPPTIGLGAVPDKVCALGARKGDMAAMRRPLSSVTIARIVHSHLLCPAGAFATCSPPAQAGIYHDAVVAELVDAQR